MSDEPVEWTGRRTSASSDEAAKDRYRAPALDKGLDILELLSEQPYGLTRAEIVKAMDRGPSEIYRMLERLVARDYVSRSQEGDRYSLSLKLFVMANRYPPLHRLLARAEPIMESFSRRAEQSCHLGVHDRGLVSIVAQVSGPGPITLSVRVGARIPLVSTASGRVLLAFHPEAESQARKAGRDLPSDVLLDQIRARGHWMGESLQAFGVTDISWPVLDPVGRALAVLTCPFVRPLDRPDGMTAEETSACLADAARDLSIG
jgi:DNA-binding IclR family transcriptional regulator